MADLLDRRVRDLFREPSRATQTPVAAGVHSESRVTRVAGGTGAPQSAVLNQVGPGQPDPGKVSDADLEILAAAFALLVREAVPVMKKLGTPLLAAALREERPWAAVAGLLADVATESLVAEADGDPLLQALAGAAQRQRELLAEAGGGLSTAAVAMALGTSRQAVDKRRRTGTLLAVPLPAGDWTFPAAQFASYGRPLEGLSEALGAFRINDPWMRLAELLAPDPDLGGRSVLQALREDGMAALPTIRSVLAGVGEHGG